MVELPLRMLLVQVEIAVEAAQPATKQPSYRTIANFTHLNREVESHLSGDNRA